MGKCLMILITPTALVTAKLVQSHFIQGVLLTAVAF